MSSNTCTGFQKTLGGLSYVSDSPLLTAASVCSEEFEVIQPLLIDRMNQRETAEEAGFQSF